MKHLIFDFGAVVFQWQPAALLARVLPQHAHDDASTQALQRDFFQGYGGAWGRFDRGTIELPELTSALMAQTGLGEAEVRAVIDAVPHELAPMSASVSLLRRLRDAGHRLFYLSNMPRPYADHLEQSHHFLSWFDDGVFSGRVQLSKPEPAIFVHALERFGVPAGDCIFLDDHPANVEAARALGIDAVLFSDAAQAEAELRQMGVLGTPA